MSDTQEFPTQHQERPQVQLTAVEENQLLYETDGNYMMEIPPISKNPLVRLIRAWLGIGPREDRLFEELQRQQSLIVLLAQQARGMRTDHEAVTQMAQADHAALGSEHGVINQLNRQTNAISSLLDRLQYYERNISLLGRARKSYDTKIAQKIAETKRKQAALEAQAHGVTIHDGEPEGPAPDFSQPADEQLTLGEDIDGDGDIPALVP